MEEKLRPILEENRDLILTIEGHYRYAIGGVTLGLYRDLSRVGLGRLRGALRRTSPERKPERVERMIRELRDLAATLFVPPTDALLRAQTLLTLYRTRGVVAERFLEVPTIKTVARALRLKESEISLLTTLASDLETLDRPKYASEVREVLKKVEANRDKIEELARRYRSCIVIPYRDPTTGNDVEFRVWIQTRGPWEVEDIPEELRAWMRTLISVNAPIEPLRGSIEARVDEELPVEENREISADMVAPDPAAEMGSFYGFAWYERRKLKGRTPRPPRWYLYRQKEKTFEMIDSGEGVDTIGEIASKFRWARFG